MINTSNNEIHAEAVKTLMENLSKDEQINLVALQMTLDYYRPRYKERDYMDIERIEQRAKEFAKFITDRRF